jgi:HAE1 family hydrophobic/amphiphilic exporter-1
MWFTRVSVANPVFATMMMAALLVLGLFSYQRLSVDQFPEIDFPVVVVSTEYPGASPESVENDVTRKIEDAVNTIAGVRTLTSRSYEARSVVIIEFELTVGSQQAAQEVREKVAAVRAIFRDTVKEPEIFRFNPDEQPIVSIAVSSDVRNLRDLTVLADQVIVKRLQNVRGVGRATIVGGVNRQIRILLDPERMRALAVGADQVVQLLKQENQDLPAGSLTRDTADRVVQIEGRVKDPRRFGELIVARRGGAPVYLSQIAQVVDGQEEEDSIALLDGKRALAIDIVKVHGANTIAVVDAVRGAMADLEQRMLPHDVKLTVVRDTGRGIRASVENVQETLIEGGLLTILIVFAFLRSWRSTVITGLTLPVAVVGSFAVLYACGYTLNVMTLMALSLAIGILIDDAIVVRENITRHLAMGKGHVQAALDGTNEIGLAVTATTFTIVAVFLPVAFMGGIIGRFFFQFGITVSAAVLISLFVSFTLDPMLSSVWRDPSLRRPPGRLAHAIDRTGEAFVSAYQDLLRWCLRRRWVVLAVAIVSFFGSFTLVPLIGTEFAPVADLGEASVEVTTPVGASLDYTALKVRQIDAALREFPEVAFTYGTINTGATVGKNRASVYVRLKPIGERTRSPEDLAQPFRKRLAQIPGLDLNIGVPGVGNGQKPVQVSIQGRDIAELDRISQRVLAAMRGIPGVVDLESSLKAAKPTVAVRLDRELASDLGVGLQQVSDTLRPLLAGEDTGTWKAPDGETYAVRVQLPKSGRESRADLDRIYLVSGTPNADGSPRLVALSQIADLAPAVGASQINRRDLQREVLVSANVYARPAGDVGRDLQARLKEIELPAGYRFVYGGSAKDIAETSGYALSALTLAVIFIYLILASQFGSFVQPLAIMASLPLSLVGVFLGLLVAGTTLNVFSAIGFIMLMGLVTKNAILLVDFANQAEADGASKRDAILAAARVRLRPIVMTTMAMILGMLPLALGIGEGAKQRAPMAHAVIGGLISSTLLTLVVVPVLLTYIRRRPHRAALPEGRTVGAVEAGAAE